MISTDHFANNCTKDLNYVEYYIFMFVSLYVGPSGHVQKQGYCNQLVLEQYVVNFFLGVVSVKSYPAQSSSGKNCFLYLHAPICLYSLNIIKKLF